MLNSAKFAAEKIKESLRAGELKCDGYCHGNVPYLSLSQALIYNNG